MVSKLRIICKQTVEPATQEQQQQHKERVGRLQRPRILMSYKRRAACEAEFFALMAEHFTIERQCTIVLDPSECADFEQSCAEQEQVLVHADTEIEAREREQGRDAEKDGGTQQQQHLPIAVEPLQIFEFVPKEFGAAHPLECPPCHTGHK